MKKFRKAVVGGVAALAATTVLAACGDAPEEETGDAAAPEANDFLPCIVSDAGGFDDKSFNQLGYEGVEAAAEQLGSEFKAVESQDVNDYKSNFEGLIAEGCDVMVAAGFALSAATVESANANPDLEYILIDDAADTDFDGEKDADNVKPLLYNTAEAAFLAGYASADFSKTGVVGTYGGEPFPTVTIFMDGFHQGVQYYNEQKDADVKVVGWDGKEKGSFTGGFDPGPAATNAAQQLLDQNADVLLPVGGLIYEGAMTAIADSGEDAVMIGVDADVFETDPRTQEVIFTSILKGMDVSAEEAVLTAGNDEFDPEAYIGTLENEGVGIAPFHNFEGEISDTLAGELEEIQAGIIDGSITVESYLAE